MENYDVIIIGGGPGGLTAAIYAGRANLKTLLIEKGGYGGRITETAEVTNYPGTTMATGQALMEKFKAHASSNSSVAFKRTTVTGVKPQDNHFVVKTKRRGDFQARMVLLDLGSTPRLLNVPGEKELAGQGVSYCATCDAEFFKDQEIYVIGSGDQAIEESEYLAKFASKINIVVLHEKGHLDCNDVAAKAIYANPKVSFIWNSTVASIEGQDHVDSIVLKDVNTGARSKHPTTGVFLFTGMTPQTQMVQSLVDCDDRGYIKVNQKQETSIPGLYAIGDCTNNYLKQVITAAADGARAIVAGENYLGETEKLTHILHGDEQHVAFVFYNPYRDQDIQAATQLSQKLSDYHVYKQDVSKQKLLYQKLQIKQPVAAALYDDGHLTKIMQTTEAD